MKKNAKSEMGILEHLAELRQRLLYCLVVVFIFAIFVYNYSSAIFSLFTEPFAEYFTSGELIGTGPAEAFILRIKLAIFAALIFAAPWIFYQFWKFVSPGLYPEEKRFIIPFVFSASILFFFGIYFAYELILPLAFEFFAGQYGILNVAPTIRISEHLSLIMKLLLAFAIVFETPLISVFLAKLGILTSNMMLNYWRYVFVFAFVLAAVLTPPDIISQVLLALPFMILYGISILLVRLIESKAND